MVKRTMADRELAQDPLLVFPAALKGQTLQFMENANDSNCPTIGCSISPERRSELMALRACMARDFPHMRRTISWYDSMSNPQGQPDQRLPPLTFLRHNTAHDGDLIDFILGQRPAAPKPYELQVVFDRSRV